MIHTSELAADAGWSDLESFRLEYHMACHTSVMWIVCDRFNAIKESVADPLEDWLQVQEDEHGFADNSTAPRSSAQVLILKD